jgi:hypothetical protein
MKIHFEVEVFLYANKTQISLYICHNYIQAINISPIDIEIKCKKSCQRISCHCNITICTSRQISPLSKQYPFFMLLNQTFILWQWHKQVPIWKLEYNHYYNILWDVMNYTELYLLFHETLFNRARSIDWLHLHIYFIFLLGFEIIYH